MPNLRLLGQILIVILFSYSAVFSQNKTIKGRLSTTKLVNVEIMDMQPVSKDNTSIVFRAETYEGEPAWGLEPKDLIVTENNDTCKVLSVEPISKSRPLNIGLAIDHSGSMAFSLSWSNIIKFIRGKGDSIKSPLDHAKLSAESFISTFNFEKDYISLIGFGSTVDLKLSPSQDTAKLLNTIRNIELSGMTALYDAMMSGMKQIKKQKGINILISLTDGLENASTSTWQNVVDFSKENEIPVYIVGLGSIDVDTLQRMAIETKGNFYHTTSSASLIEIYNKISEQIQSFYVLEYVSNNSSVTKDDQEVKISFSQNSIYLANDSTDPDVIAYLKKKRFNERLWFFGEISIYVLATSGAIVLIYRRRKNRKKGT